MTPNNPNDRFIWKGQTNAHLPRDAKGRRVYLSLERRCTCCNGTGEVYNMAGYAAHQKHEPIAIEDTYDCVACGSRGWVPIDDMRIAVHIEGE